MLNEIIKNILYTENHSPLIHCLTNPITNYNCAQVILATGAKPIMAEHPDEVEEITNQSDALLINLGNISAVRMKSMEFSLAVAVAKRIPITLDVVGVGCSNLRLKFALKILSQNPISIIKGNSSEIKALILGEKTCRGVDANKGEKDLSIEKIIEFARRFKTTILMSGKVDFITDGYKMYYCENGVEMMGSVCGTGCMLGALTAALSTNTSPIIAAASAAVLEGIAGELASRVAEGIGSFPSALIDQVYLIDELKIKEHYKLLKGEFI